MKLRTRKARWQAIVSGILWSFQWDPQSSAVSVRQHRSRTVRMVSASDIVDVAQGQRRLL